MGEQWRTNTDVKLILQHILNDGLVTVMAPNLLYQTIQEKSKPFNFDKEVFKKILSKPEVINSEKQVNIHNFIQEYIEMKDTMEYEYQELADLMNQAKIKNLTQSEEEEIQQTALLIEKIQIAENQGFDQPITLLISINGKVLVETQPYTFEGEVCSINEQIPIEVNQGLLQIDMLVFKEPIGRCEINIEENKEKYEVVLACPQYPLMDFSLQFSIKKLTTKSNKTEELIQKYKYDQRKCENTIRILMLPVQNPFPQEQQQPRQSYQLDESKHSQSNQNLPSSIRNSNANQAVVVQHTKLPIFQLNSSPNSKVRLNLNKHQENELQPSMEQSQSQSQRTVVVSIKQKKNIFE